MKTDMKTPLFLMLFAHTTSLFEVKDYIGEEEEEASVVFATLICCTSSITPTLVRVLFLG